MKCNDGSQWHLVLALQICNLRKQWGSHLTLGCRREDDCILLATAVPAATVLAAAASRKGQVCWKLASSQGS